MHSSTNDITTLSRMNSFVYAEHVTVFSLNVDYCVLFSSRVRIRIMVRSRFSIWLVSCYAHVFVLLSIVFVTLP